VRIVDVVLAPGLGAFFYDDQAAIRAGVEADGFCYRGPSVTPGFAAIRLPAQSLSIGLVLEDGVLVWGDMMSVQYSGAGGRDPLFDSASAASFVRQTLIPRLIGSELRDFRNTAAAMLAAEQPGERFHLAIEYGLSQALLRAVAHARRLTMAEVICAEFSCPLVPRRIPLYAQSGDAREINVDKMILKRVDILPHGLINSRSKFGARGEVFEEFVRRVAHRSAALGGSDYRPTLHFDVYGWIGFELGLDIATMADFIARLAEQVAPFNLNIECPADFGSRAAQIDGYAALVTALRAKGSTARIVVDERCNTLDDIRAFAAAAAGDIIQIKMPDVGTVADTIAAVLECKRYGTGAYVGGSCTETELSAAVSVHVAVATQADMILAKPGMGVDEAITIVGNEQSRLLALLERKAETTRAGIGNARA
jgi:methylaspartate ammonia-lyase